MANFETPEALGRWIFLQPCEFVIGATDATQVPPHAYHQFAFVGRSNVGKSSLINALTQRKKLARISHTPGRTQQINYFDLANQIYLVDLPGYGFAKVSKKDRNHWGRLIDSYLQSCPTLKRVFVLIDARHPLKDIDAKVLHYLNSSAVSFQVTFTKTDKSAPQPELLSGLKECLKRCPYAHHQYIHTSAHEKTGIDLLRGSVAEFVWTPPETLGEENQSK